jgi:hypothetical protein
MVQDVAPEQDILQVSSVSPAIIILPLLHTHLSPPREMCNSPDLEVGGFICHPAHGRLHITEGQYVQYV